MDYQRFLNELPALYEDWGKESVRVKSPQFAHVMHHVDGMTTTNIMQLLNFAVDCMEPDEIYCEIGCFRGSTLIGALLNHSDRMSYAVDNFSEFDTEGVNHSQLMDNLAKFGMSDQVCFNNQDFEEFFHDLRSLNIDDKFGVYLYDGAHDYRSQLMGLLLAKPFLADRALIIVDDSNWPHVQQADWDFIASHPQCQMLLDLTTPGINYPTFWNGLHVMSWDSSRTDGYDWETIKSHRQPNLIKAFYDLQSVSL